MKTHPMIPFLLPLLLNTITALPTWPSPTDELEDTIYLQTGYRSLGLSTHITPCSYSEFSPGRQTAAEWLRLAFHDMSTANIYNPPHGGIDASLAFELGTGESIGAGFNSSLAMFGEIYNSQLSVSDLIAFGVYASVRFCGGPIIPMRGGRIDAVTAGPIGIPQPQNSQGTFINQFARMGFNTSEMIQLVACGHTLGGVSAGDFPDLVTPGTFVDDVALFDGNRSFDNGVATRYANGPQIDPLVVGPSVKVGRNSDFKVFTADGNSTVKAMTSVQAFNNVCQTVLQKMIEVVDPGIVTLSDIIAPYEVKPSGLQLTLLSGGSSMSISGDIRVRTTVRKSTQIKSVQIMYLDRNGAARATISTKISGTAAGFDDSFTFYGFNTTIPTSTSISSFSVFITSTSGSTQTYNNNGVNFPISDSVMIQLPQSCLNGNKLSITAAIRTSLTTPPTLQITQKVPRASGIPIPSLSSTTIPMTKGITIGPYTLYTGTTTLSSITGTKYGVSSRGFGDTFKGIESLSGNCVVFGAGGSSTLSTFPSTSSTSQTSTASKISTLTTTTTSSSSTHLPTSSSTITSPSSKTTTSQSSTPTTTLSHKSRIGNYTFQGCYTEATNIRALTGFKYINYTTMTLEICANKCGGWTYWGVEYRGECYCGNNLNAGSVLANLTDCKDICPGNGYEYCGAGNRLEMYKLQ